MKKMGKSLRYVLCIFSYVNRYNPYIEHEKIYRKGELDEKDTTKNI